MTKQLSYVKFHMLYTYCALLRGSGALIWDSGLELATEYTRGCAILGRAQENKHHRCADFIHIGYVAIDKTTQILLNFLCNRRLAKS